MRTNETKLTSIEKCQLAIDKGFNYCPITGKISGTTSTELIHIDDNGYPRVFITHNNKRYNIRVHKLAWYWVHKEDAPIIDHINGIKTDNRICNLRPVNHQQNAFNNTKAKGCSFHKRIKKWMAYIRLDYKLYHLGYFNTEAEAREAYLEAKPKYHKITNINN